MNKFKAILFMFLSFWACIKLNAQQLPTPKFTISGTMGVTYDGYGLSSNPATPTLFPWLVGTPARAGCRSRCPLDHS